MIPRIALSFLALLATLAFLPACESEEKAPSSPGINSIIGTWELDSIEGTPVPTTRIPRRPELTITADGKVSGTGGVNRLSSFVNVNALVNGHFILSPVASTMMAGPPEAMELEASFNRALGKVNAYTIDRSTLSLRQNATEVLRFTRSQ